LVIGVTLILGYAKKGNWLFKGVKFLLLVCLYLWQARSLNATNAFCQKILLPNRENQQKLFYYYHALTIWIKS